MLFKNTLVRLLGLGGLALLIACGPSATEQSKTQVNLIDSNYVVGDTFGTDEELNTLLEQYRKEKDVKMSRVLTKTKKGLTKERPQSELTNLMADICLEQAQTTTKQHIDFGLVNFGGIRSSVPKGEVTLENAYKLMPFDNELCMVEIHRDSVLSMAEYIRKRGGEPVSGLELTFNNEKVVEVLINGKPLNTKESYWVATSDYLANGGDRMRFLARPMNRINTGLKYRDAIIQYFEDRKELNPSTQKRITYVNE